MTESRRVRIVNADGYTRFNQLIDTGSDRLVFSRGGGFVLRAEMLPGERIVPGWLTREQFDAERRERWPRLYEGGP